ncbi:MAG TPA: hypothetical protein VFL85_00605 [Candidatus Saccharimonadales bacterium]|nr:hypothetical protein [Candidatus Saccharimonadales bacterium]
MVEDIASVELGVDREAIDGRSHNLAKLCVALTTGGQVADGARYTIDRRDRRGTNNILSVVHDMVLNVENKVQATALQQELHRQVIRSIGNALTYYKADGRGHVGERTGLGLLTRYSHADMLAYPSLPHHESSPVDLTGHYDIGVILRNPDNSIDAHHLQLKAGCFGLCAKGEPTKHYNDVRKRYRPSVQLVSGCCHLGMGRDSWPANPIPKLLLKEASDAATAPEIKYLDNLTDNLLFQMTTEQLPRGQAGGNSIDIGPELYQKFLRV